jgi:hypothetical protein
LELENNELTGSVPMEIGNLVELIVLLLSNNNLVDLPSLWALSSLQFLWIQDNKLTFEDIESNIGIPSHQYIYSPQDSVGEAKDTTINEGINITLYVSADGQHTQYQWMKNGDDISSATDNLYTINSADTSDAGSYTCRITNTVATELTLYSRPINITVKTSGVPSKLPEVYSMKVKRITADKNLELRYTLPEMTNIRLSVYDITGKVIKGFSEEQQAGFYSRKIDMHGKHTGVYFIRMEAEGKKFTKTTKVVFIK